MEQIILPEKESCQKIITCLSDLEDDRDFIIFGNDVYDISVLKHSHPGGNKLIDSAKGHEVDKFIYGIYASVQYPNVPRHSHSYKSMDLLGKPFAKISIPSAFNGFDKQIVKVGISSIKKLSRKSHIIEIKVYKNEGFDF
jgi:hypothetical protein